MLNKNKFNNVKKKIGNIGLLIVFGLCGVSLVYQNNITALITFFALYINLLKDGTTLNTQNASEKGQYEYCIFTLMNEIDNNFNNMQNNNKVISDEAYKLFLKFPIIYLKSLEATKLTMVLYNEYYIFKEDKDYKVDINKIAKIIKCITSEYNKIYKEEIK